MWRLKQLAVHTREPLDDGVPVLSAGVIYLIAMGISLEIGANVVCHLIDRDMPLDECLSLLAISQLLAASVIVLRRLNPTGLISVVPILAGALFVFSKSLDVTGSIHALNQVYLVGRDFPMHKMVKDLTLFAGFLILLLSFFLAALESRMAHLNLARQNKMLLHEMEERRRLAMAIEQSGEAVVITDADGIIQYVNPAFKSLTGYAPSEAVGKKTNILKSGKHDQAFYRRLWDTLARDGAWTGHFVNRRKDGSFYEEECTISSVRNGNNTVTNYIALKHDVTAKITMERQLRHAQKMETVGSLAGRIAHDFNNILALILGHGEMALRRLSEEDPLRMNVERIVKAGNRGANMVKQIMTFSRQVEQDRRPVAIHTIVAEALDFLRATLPATIVLRENVRDCGVILADPTQVHQVVINLCTNAFQAIGMAPGTVEVGLDEHTISTGFIADAGTPPPGAYVCLTVRDTGCGMDPSIIPHIFDPFFSTKKPGEGTGLGLASVHGIVTSHGGAIMVRSEVGMGTTFEVYFPQMEGAPALSAPTSLSVTPGSEHILFVDDDTELAVLYRNALEEVGYVVTVCTNSQDALRLFQEQAGSFDIVVTDQVMPHLTGMELSWEIRSIRPECPIILLTGYMQGISRDAARAAGITDSLNKPLPTSVLASAIRRIMEKDAESPDRLEAVSSC
ncbi:MAG TPA: PAS domain S-box protein [Candidatus Hydrogenedentes bacterium]|nr:PAS domain S-box protein [Candidatus Hydrogenedentota bacterium]HPC17364.1 PAS domain S-box protein [Candidatus Hydrogenedentota bacterium]HRT20098.1 PAS domain S-box protein [Candidatus Hydrogenedentota bacterium]HRT64838.1 PAS domain S-box protein [Candidatus Hydrogenedentota bacterium]